MSMFLLNQKKFNKKASRQLIKEYYKYSFPNGPNRSFTISFCTTKADVMLSRYSEVYFCHPCGSNDYADIFRDSNQYIRSNEGRAA
jgi:hypothetical protein